MSNMAAPSEKMADKMSDKMAATMEEPSEYQRAMSVWQEYLRNCALMRALDEYAAHEAKLPKDETGVILRNVMQLRSHVRLLLGNACFRPFVEVHKAHKRTPRECLLEFVQCKTQGSVLFDCSEVLREDPRQPVVYSASVKVKWCGFKASVADIRAFTRNAALRNAARIMCDNLSIPCH